MKTKRIDKATDEEIMLAVEILRSEMEFYTKERRFGAVEVRISSEKLAAKGARKTIKTEGWVLLPTYFWP